MATPCIVKNCKNIGTHRFPKNETRRAEWIQAIQHIRPGLKVLKMPLICSAHFRPEDFSVTPTCFTKLDRAPKILKRYAVPSLFAWSQVSQIQPPQENLSSIETMNIDKSKVQYTYSRVPPISFVEIPLEIQQDIENTDDPLQDIEQNNEVCVDNNEDQLPPLCMDNIVEDQLPSLCMDNIMEDQLPPIGIDNFLEVEITVSNQWKHKLK